MRAAEPTMGDERDARILVATLLNPVGPTGVQTHFRTFLRYLEDEGHPAALVTPYSAPRSLVYPLFALRKLIDPLSATASIRWYRFWHAHFLELALARRLAAGVPCIIYAQCPLSARAAMRARRTPGQSVVMVVHFNMSQADEWAAMRGIDADGSLAKSMRALEHEVLPALDGIVYVSCYMKNHLEERLPDLKAVPSTVIPNFSRRASRQPPVAPETDLISVGTLEPRKNQSFLIEVVAELARQNFPCSLALVGDGPDRPALETLARRLRVENHVRFLGRRANAMDLMRSARIYVHAARMENMPLALIEALATGLPILAPAVGGIVDVFEDGVEGRYWDLSDVGGAARLVAQLLKDDGERARLAANALARFDSAFDAARIGARLHRFLACATATTPEPRAQAGAQYDD
jgi:glycosyltransferase involved in cell wall biosynthesis